MYFLFIMNPEKKTLLFYESEEQYKNIIAAKEEEKERMIQRINGIPHLKEILDSLKASELD